MLGFAIDSGCRISCSFHQFVAAMFSMHVCDEDQQTSLG